MESDVVIAGAGPNGLMLACELALAGVRPLVLERLTEPSSEQRANGIVGQIVRMVDRRGLYERLSGTPGPPRPAPRFMFAAFPVNFGELPDNPVYVQLVPQRRIEEVLAERAAELGVEIRRGHELVGLSQRDDAVTVEVSGPRGRYAVQARYLVGADGGHSVARKLAGIDFPGVTNDRTVSRAAHVRVPKELIDPATSGLAVPGYGVVPPFLHHRTERGLVAFAPFPDGRTLLNVSEIADPDFDAPFTIAELRAAARRVLGADIEVQEPEGPGPHMLRRLAGGNTRLADRFRAGRVLLVGDAAHVHSAIGGNGLNLGLQDAINLGWKLAAEVQGWAPPGLLDSYEAERRPVGERVTMHTMAQGVLVGPGREVTALRTLFGELLEEPTTVQHIADMISGADIRYDHMGRWAPDITLHTESGPTRLAELTRTARPLLLDMTGDGDLAAEVAPWRDRVDVATGHGMTDCTERSEGQEGMPGRLSDDTKATAMLLRPDCYVAWESESSQPDGAALRAALARWFGPGQPV
ncbi:MAG TPA: FAD-dependent monooxygenase [Actinoplanes sp.]|jgi:2-polyprenyl-6-methoxyphenol hydroxylase-like FAD-dependent oxidoreductase|nr:FAD-dependent monooxygenase [Actinoplanes sp.]